MAGKAARWQSQKGQPHRNNFAILSFKDNARQAQENGIGATFASLLTLELRKTGAFNIIDKENVKKILNQQSFALSGMTRNQNPVKVGRMLAAHYIVSGNVGFNNGKYIINVKISSVESGAVVLARAVSFNSGKLNSLAMLMRLTQKSPAVAGFRSALIPGWGQFYNNKNIKGSITLSATILTAGSAAVFTILKKISENNFNDLSQQYSSWSSWNQTALDDNQTKASSLYASMQDEKKEAELYADLTTYSLIGLSSVWLFALSDAVINAALINKKLQKARGKVNLTWNGPGQGLDLAFSYRF